MEGLTRRQEEVLYLIIRHIEEQGYPPTVQELADLLGVSSKNAIAKHLQALMQKGYIEHDSTARGIRVLWNPQGESSDVIQVPILGKVAAGFPILAEENMLDHIPIPRQLIRQEGRYFALRVNGDSMIQAGIFDGDLVLVLSTQNARHGDIVVALIGDEVTVKRLIVKDGKKFLQAENPDYPNLYPQEEWSIQGKVIGLIRDHI